LSTKNILLTNLRSAVSLDLAKSLSLKGHRIFAVDSFINPLIKKSRYLLKTKLVSSPSRDFSNYRNDILEFVKENEINVILPVYEESFWIAKLKPDLPQSVFCFCDDFSKMTKLHNKFLFIKLCQDIGLTVPKTLQVHSINQLEKLWDSNDSILKPVFSRFASNVIFSSNCSYNKLRSLNLEISEKRPWVYQERIRGKEFCSYSLAHEGRLTGHMVYSHDFTAGKGAGISFESVEIPEILDWVKKFVFETNYTGQICFDFMLTESGVFPLECNPRATSGVHLLSQLSDFSSMILEKNVELSHLNQGHKAYLSLMAMFVYGLVQINNLTKLKSFLDIILNGRNILHSYKDENYFVRQLSTLISLYQISSRHKVSLLEASTLDIEYNGY
jgi:glutathione synthase/RimK-type ligase-like ATP-grasp enzyme